MVDCNHPGGDCGEKAFRPDPDEQNSDAGFYCPSSDQDTGGWESSSSTCHLATTAHLPGWKYGPYFSRRTSQVLGLILFVVGIASAVGGVLALIFSSALDYLASGFWCGAFYTFSGIAGFSAGFSASDKLIYSTAIASVFDIAFGMVQITVSAIGLDYDINCYSGNHCTAVSGSAVAANSVMVLTGLLAVIFGTWLLIIASLAVHAGSRIQAVAVGSKPQTMTTGQTESRNSSETDPEKTVEGPGQWKTH